MSAHEELDRLRHIAKVAGQLVARLHPACGDLNGPGDLELLDARDLIVDLLHSLTEWNPAAATWVMRGTQFTRPCVHVGEALARAHAAVLVDAGGVVAEIRPATTADITEAFGWDQ